jgi:nucleotide-binding universal stress UspA family protein
MTESAQGTSVPKRLLLATDLSARCDRALDRAAQLAEVWQAEIVAVNVLDLGSTPDQILAWASGATEQDLRQIALQELRRNTAGVSAPISLRVERGNDAAEVICKVAGEVGADLVVSSVARNEVLGRFLLGSTVEQLARSVAQPLLVVRQRPRHALGRVLPRQRRPALDPIFLLAQQHPRFFVAVGAQHDLDAGIQRARGLTILRTSSGSGVATTSMAASAMWAWISTAGSAASPKTAATRLRSSSTSSRFCSATT